jgi:hypothetical protein
MKCNETIGKWCKNKHGASKIIDTFETYQAAQTAWTAQAAREDESAAPRTDAEAPASSTPSRELRRRQEASAWATTVSACLCDGRRGQRACSWVTAAYLTLLIHAGGRSVDDQWKEGRAAAASSSSPILELHRPIFSPRNRLELPAKKVTPLPPIPKPRSIPSSACLRPIRWGELAVSCPKRLRFRRVIG